VPRRASSCSGSSRAALREAHREAHAARPGRRTRTPGASGSSAGAPRDEGRLLRQPRASACRRSPRTTIPAGHLHRPAFGERDAGVGPYHGSRVQEDADLINAGKGDGDRALPAQRTFSSADSFGHGARRARGP
jgi:hypothetical protein